jgi:hypothetical protein
MHNPFVHYLELTKRFRAYSPSGDARALAACILCGGGAGVAIHHVEEQSHHTAVLAPWKWRLEGTSGVYVVQGGDRYVVALV